MAETLIKNFAQISKTDTLIAGGKGASLGEMTRAGILVPDGFVILSNAFDRFLEETDLNVEIDAVLDKVNIKEVHTVENASEKIQAMILSQKMPEDIEAEILKFYKNLDCKFAAVRSSATSEDSASAAWAGQLDSFLNTTKETLLENVKRCWASLFTPRAIFYRFEKKLDKDKISVAVVVQKMVDSEKSGVAFSVHPVTQDENQIIIEAGFGLGEAIVSGSITPDSYVVDKQRFSILDININKQTKALYKKAKGGNEWKELGEKGKKQVLSKKEIIELSKLIVKIENHYGFPCDIEWAKEKKKFYITQSRPITTLAKETSEKKNKNKDIFWINHISRDMSLTAIWYPYYSYIKGLKSFYANGPNMFYFSRRGFIKGYKDKAGQEITYKGIRKIVSKGKLKEVLSKFEKLIKQREVLVNRFCSADLSKKTLGWIKDKVSNFHEFYKTYWNYHLFCFNLGEALTKTKYETLLEDYKDLILKVRQVNPYLIFDEKFLPHLYNYLSKKENIEQQLLFYLLPPELLNYINKSNKLPLDKLKKRQEYSLLADLNGKEYFYSGKKALQKYEKLILKKYNERQNIKEFKGNTAFRGKVIGVATIVKLKKDLKKIKGGSILITPQTTPEFTPYLKKVSGIITDEGGIMSHAAIASRELKIPCLIGTSIATKVLKDGDFVELDTDNEIVRILKRAKKTSHKN